MRLLIVLLAIIPVAAFGAGEGESAPATTAANDSAEHQEKEAPRSDSGIILPDGWAMEDAISAEDVEGIMKTTGLVVFPEAASSKSKGRPIGSYNLSGVPYSKVRFEGNVADGQEAYERAVGFLSDATEIENPRWDAALMGDAKLGDKTATRMLVLKGDHFFMISWVPEVFPELDPKETNVKLAELLITNLYGK
ncbi:hypothetical protein Thiowin_02194 [Thiorhodovibrio winogradskyi]|uniref:Lipoprotein n=1 Tax=Thiorhodovibrio winogradskyi TaxID=77007 RepID=A0ABZ0S866_9GAMM|nr:hypothetical protein [Thiorhodovibrio winogradskyi]